MAQKTYNPVTARDPGQYGVRKHDDMSWQRAKNLKQVLDILHRKPIDVATHFMKDQTEEGKELFAQILHSGLVKKDDFKRVAFQNADQISPESQEVLCEFLGVEQLWQATNNGKCALDIGFDDSSRFHQVFERIDYFENHDVWFLREIAAELGKSQKWTHFDQNDFENTSFLAVLVKFVHHPRYKEALGRMLSDYLTRGKVLENGKALATVIEATEIETADMSDLAKKLAGEEVFDLVLDPFLSQLHGENKWQAVAHFAETNKDKFEFMCNTIGTDNIAKHFAFDEETSSQELKQLVADTEGRFLLAAESGKLGELKMDEVAKNAFCRKFWIDPKTGETEFHFAVGKMVPQSREDYYAIFDDYVASGMPQADYCKMRGIANLTGFAKMVKRVLAQDEERAATFKNGKDAPIGEVLEQKRQLGIIFNIGRNNLQVADFFANDYTYPMSLTEMSRLGHERMDYDTLREFLDRIIEYYFDRLNEYGEIKTLQDVFDKGMTVSEIAFVGTDMKKTSLVDGFKDAIAQKSDNVGCSNNHLRDKFYGKSRGIAINLKRYDTPFKKEEYMQMSTAYNINGEVVYVSEHDIDTALGILADHNIYPIPNAVSLCLQEVLRNRIAAPMKE